MARLDRRRRAGRDGVNGERPKPPVADPAPAASRVRASFAKQAFMQLLGAELSHVAPGECDITLSYRTDLVQQHGFLHAGVSAAIADSACGYAALSLMPADAAVLSIEYKVNMLAPAAGARFVARGRVLRSGRTITVVRGTVHALTDDGESTQVLELQGTMMAVQGRGLAD